MANNPFKVKPYSKLGRISTPSGKFSQCVAEPAMTQTQSASELVLAPGFEVERSAVAVVPQSRLRSTLIELVGSIAGACTTAAFLPQVYTVYTTGNTDGLSLPMYCIFVAGVFMWIM